MINAVLAVAVLAAGFVQGATGFGFSIVAVPVFMLFLPPITAVPVMSMLSFVNAVYMVIQCRAHLKPRLVLPLIAGAMIGQPIGIYFLTRLEGPWMKIFVGAFMTMFALVLLAGWRRPIRNQRIALPFVGILSGFLGGSSSLSGPPVVLFLASQDTPKDTFRANLVGYFSLLGLMAQTQFAFHGMTTRTVLGYSAAFMPLLMVSTVAGHRASGRIDERLFNRLSMSCAAVMGAILVVVNLAEVLSP